MNPSRRPWPALPRARPLTACREEQAAETPPVRPVLSVVVEPQTRAGLGFAGTVEPRYKSDLGFRVLGRIISRDVNVGDVVRKGQRLAALDPVAYQLAVRSAQAELVERVRPSRECRRDRGPPAHAVRANIATQADFEAAEQPREAAEAGVTQRQGQSRQGRGAARLHRASRRLRRCGHRGRGRGRAGGVAGRDRRHGGPPGHPRGGHRPARELGRVSAPGPASRWRCELDPGGAGCRRGARDRAAGGPGHPNAAGPDHARRSSRRASASARRSRRWSPTTGSSGIELPASALLERDGKTMVWVVDPAAQTRSRPAK